LKAKFAQIFHTRKSHIENYIWRALQLGSRQGVVFLILFISAKLLTPEELGIYTYTIAFGFLFSLFADFGISKAVSKFVAEFNISDPEKVNAIFFYAALTLFSIIVILTFLFISFEKEIVGKNYIYIKYLLPLFFFLPFSSLYDGIYLGLKKFKILAVIALIAGAISVTATYFLISKYRLVGTFLALDLYYFLLFILFAVSYKNYSFTIDKKLFAVIWKYSIIIGISGLGHFLYSKANVIILGKFNYFVEAGYYELIDKIFMLFTFGVLIFGQVIAPKVTELYTEKQYNLLFSYFKKIITAVFILGVIISLILFFISPIFMKFFLSKYLTENFSLMFNLLLIHLPLVFISSCIAQPFVIGTGFAKYSLITIPSGILNIIISIILVRNFGFVGVVYGVLVISIISKLLLFYLIYRRLRIA